MNDTFVVVYIVASLAVIIFQYWYIRRLRRVIEFAAASLKKFAIAMTADEPAKEVERVTNDIKNFK